MTDDPKGFDEDDDVVGSIFARHKARAVTDVRARAALISYLEALAPEDWLSPEDLQALEVYADITLQLHQRTPRLGDPTIDARIDVLRDVGKGLGTALHQIRTPYQA